MQVATNLDAVFLAMGDPTRRAILARLARGEATVGELAEPFAMTQPAVSQHLKVLEEAGLVVGGGGGGGGEAAAEVGFGGDRCDGAVAGDAACGNGEELREAG